MQKNTKNEQIKDKKKKKKQAFTLVELIVVITILAILWTIAFISFQWYSKNARNGTRLADLNNISKSLELFYNQKWFLPNPDWLVNMTYSGSIAWIQWTFWDSSVKNVDKLNKKPVDPLTLNEYTYSITNLKNEYQLWAVYEWWSLAYSTETKKWFPLIEQSNAAWLVKANAIVLWSYNGKIIKINSGTTIYILAVPSIINWDITNTDIITMITNKSLVYNNFTNIPDSYKNLWYSMTWWFDFIPQSNILVYSWTVDWLKQEDNRVLFIDNLKKVYSNTILTQDQDFKQLIESDTITNKLEAVKLSNNIIDNYIWKWIAPQNQTTVTQASLLNPFSPWWTSFTTVDWIWSNDCTWLWEDHNWNMWVWSRGGGVSKYNWTTWTNYTTWDWLLSDEVFWLFEDSSWNMWFANWWWAWAQKYDWTTWTTYTPWNSWIPADWLSLIREDNLWNIWFGTDWWAAKFNWTTWTTYTTLNSWLPNNQVYWMLEDLDWNMWFWTSWGGAAKLSSTWAWSIYNIANSWFLTNNVGVTSIDNSWNIWIWTFNWGINRYNKATSTWSIYWSWSLWITTSSASWFIDDNGTYWLASHSWLIKSTGTNWLAWQLYNTWNSWIISNTIEMIVKDRFWNIWISTNAWISVFNPN